MIIKFFDMYSQATKDLILGTARLFKEFTIYKPATSRPCNSERYFIGRGYSGSSTTTSKLWISHLQKAQLKHATSPLTRLVNFPWSSNILVAVQEQIDYQEQKQIQTIQETLTFTKEELPQKIKTCLQMSTEWCTTFKIPIHPVYAPSHSLSV